MRFLTILFAPIALLTSCLADELRLPELFKKSDLVCIGKVLNLQRTGRIEERQFGPDDYQALNLPPTVRFSGPVELERCISEVDCQSLLKGTAPRTITVHLQYRPKRTGGMYFTDVRSEIDYMMPEKTYLIYLRKEGGVYRPATFTKSAILLTSSVNRSDTVSQILKKQFVPQQTTRRLESLLRWLNETMSEEEFSKFLREYADQDDKRVRGLVYKYLMRADRPKIMAGAFKLMRSDPQDQMRLRLSSCVPYAFTVAPACAPESLQLLEDALRSAAPGSTAFHAAIETLEHCSREKWDTATAKLKKTPASDAVRSCKPAVIECLRSRQNVLSQKDQYQLLVILTNMDGTSYAGQWQEFSRSGPDRIRRVLAKYPRGWNKKQER